MTGHDVLYVCADDTHGTATMIKADSEDVSPEVLVETIRLEHLKDFQNFLINHDNYYSTHSNENRFYVESIYKKLKEKNSIFTKEVQQLFDTKRAIFLADRYVIGTCPKCATQNQYGDNCESCGATYNATELINAKSIYSGSTPGTESFAALLFWIYLQYEIFLKEWIQKNTVQPEVANKLFEWLDGRTSSTGIYQEMRPILVFRFQRLKENTFMSGWTHPLAI